MKIEREFKPVTITLETPKELADFMDNLLAAAGFAAAEEDADCEQYLLEIHSRIAKTLQ